MRALANWANPLAKLPPIVGHPSLLLDDSPTSSSSPRTPKRFRELQQNSRQTLNNYSPDHSMDDDTPEVLGVFLDNLFDPGGQISLMEEIDEFKDHPHMLRLLRNFLVDVILKPRTSLPLCINTARDRVARLENICFL
jgi:hypothetical protein